MADMHITRELLEAIARGEIPGWVLGNTILEHLKEACPDCTRELEVFAREQKVERWRKSLEPLHRHSKDRQHGQDRARRDVAKLLTLPRDERITRIRRSRTRYRGPQVAWILLEESRTAVNVSPDEAKHLAELARLVVQSSPGWVGCVDLLALSTALLANACRARGELAEADSHFEDACSLITHQGGTDPEILGRIDYLEGLLRMDLRDFEAAEKLLSRAALLFSVAGETVEHARALFKLSSMHELQGDLTRAIETLQAGLQERLPSEARYLYLCGRYNLALLLTESGQPWEAAGILQEDEELYGECPDPLTQLRLFWLRGKIEAGCGDEAAAEEHFLAARAGLLAQEYVYDAAMFSKDLAMMYLRQGRIAEFQQLAEETGIFWLMWFD